MLRKSEEEANQKSLGKKVRRSAHPMLLLVDKSTDCGSFSFLTWRLLHSSSFRGAVGAESLIEEGSRETQKRGTRHSCITILRSFAVKGNREMG